MFFSSNLKEERYPAVVAQVVEDDLAQYARNAEVAADAIDGDVSSRAVLVVGIGVVNVNVDTRPLRAQVAATEWKTVLGRLGRSVTDISIGVIHSVTHLSASRSTDYPSTK